MKVGPTPWPTGDPQVAPGACFRESLTILFAGPWATTGSPADQRVGPTGDRVRNRARCVPIPALVAAGFGRVTNPPQVDNLPHNPGEDAF